MPIRPSFTALRRLAGPPRLPTVFTRNARAAASLVTGPTDGAGVAPPQGGIIRGLAGAAGRPALTVTPPALVIPPPPQFADNQPPAPLVPPPRQFADNPPAPPVPPKSQAAREMAAAIKQARSRAVQPQQAEHRPAPVSPPTQAPQTTSPPPKPPAGSKPLVKPKPATAQRVPTRLAPAKYAQVSIVETVPPSSPVKLRAPVAAHGGGSPEPVDYLGIPVGSGTESDEDDDALQRAIAMSLEGLVVDVPSGDEPSTPVGSEDEEEDEEETLRRAIALSLEGHFGDEEPHPPVPRRVRFADKDPGPGATGRTGGILKDTSKRGAEAASLLGDRQAMLAPVSNVSRKSNISRLYTPDNLIFVTEAGGTTQLTFSDGLGSTGSITLHETELMTEPERDFARSSAPSGIYPLTNRQCFITLPDRMAVGQLARELRSSPMLPANIIDRAAALGGSGAGTAGQILMEATIDSDGLIHSMRRVVGRTVSSQRFEAMRERVDQLFLRLMGLE